MAIWSFDGPHNFLSNFHPSPFFWQGQRWPTVEHAFAASKASSLEDREYVRLATTPGRANRAGREVELRPDWEKVKWDVMLQCVREKFKQNSRLREKLLATGHEHLIEGNNWGDRIWGVTLPELEGENWLGQILSIVREELRTKC